ncbi:hypothetical protein HYW55_05725 [Candidatus Gottesmanbacteria bacterium]|nr:hypothetical protein [Candidatus Gottesmanbacteria bacterium]
MIYPLYVLLLGMLAGLHAACYGAYKDSPYERFKLNRFVREISIGAISALFIFFSTETRNVHPAILFLSFVACSRIFTESYKLFIREESQKKYKIPSMLHIFKNVLTSRLQRILIGVVAYVIFAGFFVLAFKISSIFSIPISGVLIGLITGLITGFGGAYKDGFFEGFQIRKFFRSPIIGALSGYLLSYLTAEPLFLLLSSWGLERMIVEFYKGFVKAKYVPGKFNFIKARYPEYFLKRKRIIPAYVATWFTLVFLLLYRI